MNLGHTIGHGIEGLLAPDWLHGECVAVGIQVEMDILRRAGIVS